MIRRWDRNTGGLDFRNQLAEVPEGSDGMRSRARIDALRVKIANADELHFGHFRVYARVSRAEFTHTDHADAERTVHKLAP